MSLGQQITFDLARNVYWLVGVIISLILVIFRMGYNARHNKLRIEVLERDLNVVRNDSAQLTVSMLAVLSGLQRLGCNGEVSTAHVELERYLATNRIEHIKGYWGGKK